MFTDDQKRSLVMIARAAVADAAHGRRERTVAVEAGAFRDAFPDVSGAFVTIKRGGRLRGCIGTLSCQRPLSEEVARVAVSAATEDPRFEPLRPSELDDLDIEVSILGPLERIDPFDETSFEIGRHGLVVDQGHRRGLLLPQVATEHGWDRETFLAQTCVKAGLPPDAWRRGAEVYRFSGEAFGSDP
jgi:hypothetical protein